MSISRAEITHICDDCSHISLHPSTNMSQLAWKYSFQFPFQFAHKLDYKKIEIKIRHFAIHTAEWLKLDQIIAYVNLHCAQNRYVQTTASFNESGCDGVQKSP